MKIIKTISRMFPYTFFILLSLYIQINMAHAKAPDDLVELHTKKWDELVLKIANGAYEPANPYIELDPFRLDNNTAAAPLTALIGVKTLSFSHVSVTVKGKTPETDVSYQFTEESMEHFIPIAGLYPDYANIVEVSYVHPLSPSLDETYTYTIQTEPLPDDFPIIEELDPALISQPERMQRGLTFIGVQTHGFIGIDANHEVRWYVGRDLYSNQDISEDWSSFIRTENGNFLFTNTFYQLNEVDILGRCIKQTNTDFRMHHDLVELPNGNILMPAEVANAFTSEPEPVKIEDQLVELDYNSLAPKPERIKYFDFKNIIDESRFYQPNIDEDNEDVYGIEVIDWMHMNRGDYNPESNSYMISSRHQDAVIAFNQNSSFDSVTHEAGADIRWILGAHDNWTIEYQPYLLIPVDENGNSDGNYSDKRWLDRNFWNWGQHSATFLPDQDNNPSTVDIILFDNGNFRSFDSSYWVNAADNSSRYVHYRIDEVDKTVQLIYEYSDQYSYKYYSGYVGNVVRYSDNNESGTFLINYGGANFDGEGNKIGTPNGDPEDGSSVTGVFAEIAVTEVDFETGQPIFGVKISNGDTGHFSFYSFKSLRFPMYPDNLELNSPYH
ncbi:aryl-sulfate sulfotransferase [Vibrio sp. BS-M-Sm-2]|uniref:aryl-sulfate sulfotransferase n=1 Tax=Vibrio sp. BS-M-Sm-2 TaxID=3241167 RepID=UPI0035561968